MKTKRSRWTGKSPEEISLSMTHLATYKWAQKSKKERKAHSLMMVEAKRNKKQNG